MEDFTTGTGNKATTAAQNGQHAPVKPAAFHRKVNALPTNGNGSHANGSAPTTTGELRLCAIGQRAPHALLGIPKANQPERPYFENPVAGCLWAAQTIVAEQVGQDLRPDAVREDTDFLLTTWAVDSEQPQKAALAVKARRLLKEIGNYLALDDNPDNDEQNALNLAVSLWSEQQERRAKKAKATAQTPSFPTTETGNAERFVAQHHQDVRYCVTYEKWLLWSDGCWARDEINAVQRLCKQTVRSIGLEAQQAKEQNRRVDLFKHAAKSESRASRAATVALAQSEPGIPVTAADLDKDVWLFNVRNGTINLTTGQIQPHSRADLITKMAPVIFDPHAQCPLFLAYLEAIFRGRESLIRFLKRVIGYTLTGDTREQIFLLLHGKGSNGKSLLLSLILELFGDYGHTMEPETITVKKQEKMATDIAELDGKRFVACSETDDGKRLGEAIIKRSTGGEQLTGERKFERAFTFTPQFQIFFSTNHMPEIRGTDPGIWRRIQKIPFDVTFWDPDKGQSGPPELKADKTLRDKLRAELPGILAWAVQGCLEWQREGLGTPEEVISATALYREEQDHLGGFLSERCVRIEGVRARAADLYVDYGEWCKATGEWAIKQKRFGQELGERGFEPGREAGTGKSIWKGIGLIANQSKV